MVAVARVYAMRFTAAMPGCEPGAICLPKQWEFRWSLCIDENDQHYHALL